LAQGPAEKFCLLIIFPGIYGYPDRRPLPSRGRQGPVEAEKFRVAVEIGAYMFPFRPRSGFPFRPEEGFGVHRFHPRPIGKAAVCGVIRIKEQGFPVDSLRGVGEHKGIIRGGPDDPVRGKTADGSTVTAKDILLGPGDKFEPRLLRQGSETGKAVLRTGKDVKLAGDPFQRFHDP
jgi:hypothetical protein